MSFLPFKNYSAPSSPFSIDDAFEIPEDIAEEDEDNDDETTETAARPPIIKPAAAARLRLEEDPEDPHRNGGGATHGTPQQQADSASLIQSNGSKGGGGYYEGPPPVKYWWRHAKIRQNWKVMTAAFVLCFIGVGLILGGIVAYTVPSMAGIQGAVFLIAGVICFVPGAYHIGYVYLAVKGKRGYEFHHLPLFNS